MTTKKKAKTKNAHPVGGLPAEVMDVREVPAYVGVTRNWVGRLRASGRLRVWTHPDYPQLEVVDRAEMTAWRSRVIETNRGNSDATKRFRASVPPTLAKLEAKVGKRGADYLAHIHKLYGFPHLKQSGLAVRDRVSRQAVQHVVNAALKKLLKKGRRASPKTGP